MIVPRIQLDRDADKTAGCYMCVSSMSAHIPPQSEIISY